MPRVALTETQRREFQKADFYKAVLEALNTKRSVMRSTNQDFAKKIGISAGTWSRWNNGHIEAAEVGALLNALLICGYKMEVRT